LPKLLDDIRHATASAAQFTERLEFSDYERNMMVRSATERQFEIIGETLKRLQRVDPDLATKVASDERILDCCKYVMSGLPEDVDDAEVWSIVRTSLPELHAEVKALLATVEEP
jgi:uncharacterized protein with HEPN domain